MNVVSGIGLAERDGEWSGSPAEIATAGRAYCGKKWVEVASSGLDERLMSPSEWLRLCCTFGATMAMTAAAISVCEKAERGSSRISLDDTL